MECVVCYKPLSGGSDTFSDITTPMCQQCFFELRDSDIAQANTWNRLQTKIVWIEIEEDAHESETRHLQN